VRNCVTDVLLHEPFFTIIGWLRQTGAIKYTSF
jgi:hypothetical protein